MGGWGCGRYIMKRVEERAAVWRVARRGCLLQILLVCTIVSSTSSKMTIYDRTRYL